MKNLFERIKNFFKELRKRKKEDIDLLIEIVHPINDIYWERLTVIENNIMQLKIDHYLNFISDDIFEKNMLELHEKLQVMKKEYLEALANLA